MLSNLLSHKVAKHYRLRVCVCLRHREFVTQKQYSLREGHFNKNARIRCHPKYGLTMLSNPLNHKVTNRYRLYEYVCVRERERENSILCMRDPLTTIPGIGAILSME